MRNVIQDMKKTVMIRNSIVVASQTSANELLANPWER